MHVVYVTIDVNDFVNTVFLTRKRPHDITDSLKPFVFGPVREGVSKFFAENKLELLEHRPQWGGAVHFALTATEGIAKLKSD